MNIGNTAVKRYIPLVNEAGEALTVSSVEYKVTDETGAVIVARTALTGFETGSAEAEVTLTSAQNQLADGAYQGFRLIQVYATTPDGVILIEDGYAISAETILTVMGNSFQTYQNALMIAATEASAESFNSATKSEKVYKLISAYKNILALKFKCAGNLAKVTPAKFAELPADFRSALALAQVIEANALLGGDEHDEIRDAGLLSVTVGESKQFYSSKKPVKLSVNKKTLSVLGKYVDYTVRIGRDASY